MKASCQEEHSLSQRLTSFLLDYRATPDITTNISPAELFLSRPLHTQFDLLKPQVKGHVLARQADQKLYHNKNSKHRPGVHNIKYSFCWTLTAELI